MDFTLKRTVFDSTGIYGYLIDADGTTFCATIEHQFQQIDGSWRPAIASGIYTCRKGIHRLDHGSPFTTFEVCNVPGHSGCLIHPGNSSKDSEGCILVGEEGPANTITQSRATFNAFMQLQEFTPFFTLTVQDVLPPMAVNAPLPVISTNWMAEGCGLPDPDTDPVA